MINYDNDDYCIAVSLENLKTINSWLIIVLIINAIWCHSSIGKVSMVEEIYWFFGNQKEQRNVCYYINVWMLTLVPMKGLFNIFLV